MSNAASTRRKSKYTEPLWRALTRLGHATNAELGETLRGRYPNLSDTTVHRITQRLITAGEVQYAPHAADGAMVFDSNTAEHDHFRCSDCDALRDITIPANVRTTLQQLVPDCHVTGSLMIVGICCACIGNNKEEKL